MPLLISCQLLLLFVNLLAAFMADFSFCRIFLLAIIVVVVFFCASSTIYNLI